MHSHQFDLSFVILTWNSVRYIKSCIESYSSAINREELSAEFLIIDNGSSDGTTDLIEAILFQTLPSGCLGKLYKLEKNLGTTKSRNIALKKALGQNIVICDSDTEYLSGSWRDALAILQQDRDIGIIAPHLVYPNGKIQNSVKKFPTILDKIVKLGKIFFNLPDRKADFYEDFPWPSIREVDTAISACWIFKRELLESVGFLDERIFYSPEDIDYCLRIWKKKKRIIYYPFLKIKHHTQQITHVNPLSAIAFSHFLGLLYYFVKHKYFFSRDRLYKCLGLKSRK